MKKRNLTTLLTIAVLIGLGTIAFARFANADVKSIQTISQEDSMIDDLSVRALPPLMPPLGLEDVAQFSYEKTSLSKAEVAPAYLDTELISRQLPDMQILQVSEFQSYGDAPSFEERIEQDSTGTFSQIVSSLRYETNKGDVFVNVSRLSPGSLTFSFILGNETIQLQDGTQAGLTSQFVGSKDFDQPDGTVLSVTNLNDELIEPANRVVVAQSDMLISIHSDLAATDLIKLAEALVIHP